MKVVYEDVVIPNVPDVLTEAEVRTVLVSLRPSAANASATRTTDAGGETVLTFTPKAAEKGC